MQGGLLYEGPGERPTKLYVRGSVDSKYLGIILRGDLSWVDHVNYMVKKAWNTLHFIIHILKRGIVVPKA